MIKDFVSLSFENLKHRGIRSWLTMLGIFIGIAAVVALISLGSALQSAITGQFTTLSPDRLLIQNAETGFGPPGSTAAVKLTSHDLDVIKSVPGVERAVPRYIRTVKVEFNKAAIYSYVGDLPEDRGDAEFVYSSFDFKVQSGRLLESTDRGKVLVGNDFTKTGNFGKPVKVGDTIIINEKDFKVVGIMAPLSSALFNGIILMPNSDVKSLLNVDDEIDTIAVKTASPDITDDVATNIENKLRQDRHEDIGEEDFTVQTPVQAVQSITTVLNIINLIVVGIAAISLFVGGIGIANTMYTSVLERTKEIGVMKSVGATNKNILFIFLIESSLLGLAGGVIGALMGLGFAFLVSAITRAYAPAFALNISVSYPLLFSAILFSLLIGGISGVLPALQASKLKPVVALRK